MTTEDARILTEALGVCDRLWASGEIPKSLAHRATIVLSELMSDREADYRVRSLMAGLDAVERAFAKR